MTFFRLDIERLVQRTGEAQPLAHGTRCPSSISGDRGLRQTDLLPCVWPEPSGALCEASRSRNSVKAISNLFTDSRSHILQTNSSRSTRFFQSTAPSFQGAWVNWSGT